MGERTVEIRCEQDVIVARQAGRDMACKLGFGTADQTRLATAISELTRNVVQHAKNGVCTIAGWSGVGEIVIRVTVEDGGPGIPDIDKAMADGFSTIRGLGAGLPGTRRLVHTFHIESTPRGTRVVIAMVRKRP